MITSLQNILVKLILLPFSGADITQDQIAFLKDNAKKHLRVLIVTALLIPLMVWGLLRVNHEALPILVGGLAAPVFVTGAAWFVITFGAVPEALLNVAMVLTRRMFTAFTVSLSLCFIAVGYVCPWQLRVILLIIWALTWSAAFLYDCIDGLKMGLEPALLRHAHLGARYFYKQLEGKEPGDPATPLK